mmetsp:Transcript_21350/g.42743  ORF Transcript_21350/g.42743 Transcript_21350/m.42743 type:complete len:246 (-) Transcript_21350:932-1669(-)
MFVNLHHQIACIELISRRSRHIHHLSVDGAGHHRFHFHRTQNQQGVAGSHGIALGHLGLQHDSRHGRPDAAGHVRQRLRPRRPRRPHAPVGDVHHPRLPVELELEVHVPVVVRHPDPQELDHEGLARLELDGELLPDPHPRQEGPGVERAEAAEGGAVRLEVVEDGGVEGGAHRVDLADVVVAVLVAEGRALAVEVVGGQFGARAALEGHQIGALNFAPLKNLGAQRFWKSVGRNAEVALEVFDD